MPRHALHAAWNAAFPGSSARVGIDRPGAGSVHVSDDGTAASFLDYVFLPMAMSVLYPEWVLARNSRSVRLVSTSRGLRRRTAAPRPRRPRPPTACRLGTAHSPRSIADVIGACGTRTLILCRRADPAAPGGFRFKTMALIGASLETVCELVPEKLEAGTSPTGRPEWHILPSLSAAYVRDLVERRVRMTQLASRSDVLSESRGYMSGPGGGPRVARTLAVVR